MSDHADLPGSTLQEAVPSQQHDPLQTSEHGSSCILSSCATACGHALDVHDAYADLVLQGVSPWQQRDQYANAFEILAAAGTALAQAIHPTLDRINTSIAGIADVCSQSERLALEATKLAYQDLGLLEVVDNMSLWNLRATKNMAFIAAVCRDDVGPPCEVSNPIEERLNSVLTTRLTPLSDLEDSLFTHVATPLNTITERCTGSPPSVPS